MTSPEVVVLDDAAAVARRAAALIGSWMGRSLALSGGSTPESAYRLLSREQVDWSSVDVYAVDERFLPPGAHESNWRMISTAFLDSARVPQRRRHPVPEANTPDEAASRYAEVVDEVAFDVCVLGIGADGHTASLFPGAPELAASGAVVSTPPRGDPLVERVSLTLDAINRSRRALFIVIGEAKAGALAAALARGPIEECPARGVSPRTALVWIVDRAAASRIRD